MKEIKAENLFCGISAMETLFADEYGNHVGKSMVQSVIKNCFHETAVNELRSVYKPIQKERLVAKHLAELDVLDIFVDMYVRKHRNYRYCRGSGAWLLW